MHHSQLLPCQYNLTQSFPGVWKDAVFHCWVSKNDSNGNEMPYGLVERKTDDDLNGTMMELASVYIKFTHESNRLSK
jgi:hypothetical protein